MDLMTIGAFAELTRLSPKALRPYDRLGLVPPARTDPVNGYRFYSEDQVAGALEAWIRERRREPAGALRQVLIADQRTAAPDTPVCDLSVPLR